MARTVVLSKTGTRRTVAVFYEEHATIFIEGNGGIGEISEVRGVPLADLRPLAEAAGLVVLDAGQVRALVEWAELGESEDPRDLDRYRDAEEAALAVAESLRERRGS